MLEILLSLLGTLLVIVAVGFVVDARLPRRRPHQRQTGTPPFAFPPGFLWGAACADHQVEHAQADDWSAFEQDARLHRRDKVQHPGTPDSHPEPGHIKGIVEVPALWLQNKTDFDNRFASDFDLARQMGHNAHRFSLSWARLFPREGMSAPDPKGVDFYSRIIDALLERQMTPLVTLFHFATPQWLWRTVDGKRGVERADAADQFASLTRACAGAFGDRVRFWTTINEPLVYAVMGYLDGFFPPHERRTQAQVRPVVTQLVEMHRLAHEVLKADARQRQQNIQVGIAQHMRVFMPWSNQSLLDRITAWSIERNFVWEFLERTSKVCDYIGVNYYGRSYVKSAAPGKFEVLAHDDNEPDEERSDLGWATDHEGLERMLLRTSGRYQKPIYVLENGMADHDDDDARRQRFLVGQTQAVWRAIQGGADVRGYLHWSLTDNLEWAEGFEPRFGLVKVDYANDFKRTPRGSAHLFQRIATTNSISADDWSALHR